MAAPKVAIVAPGDPLSPTFWSGTTRGLTRGLRELGVEVVTVDSRPPRAVLAAARAAIAPRFVRAARPAPGRALLLADMSPAMGTLLKRTAERRLRACGADVVVQIGAGHWPPAERNVVTIEDMTVPLAVAAGYPLWRALPDRVVHQRRRLQASVYAQARFCCFLTSWAAKSAREAYGVPDEKIRIIGVGRNHDPQRSAGRDWSRPRFLFVGRQWKRKRGDAVVRAFAQVRSRFPDARLDVVGDHPPLSGPGVTGHGPIAGDAVSKLFSIATCFVLPSQIEPAGIVYAEAVAAGIPSIGTAVGGAREIIGEAGRIVQPDDDEALLAAMLELADAEVARTLGELALERAPKFTWRAVAERVLPVLSSA